MPNNVKDGGQGVGCRKSAALEIEKESSDISGQTSLPQSLRSVSAKPLWVRSLTTQRRGRYLSATWSFSSKHKALTRRGLMGSLARKGLALADLRDWGNYRNKTSSQPQTLRSTSCCFLDVVVSVCEVLRYVHRPSILETLSFRNVEVFRRLAGYSFQGTHPARRWDKLETSQPFAISSQALTHCP